MKNVREIYDEVRNLPIQDQHQLVRMILNETSDSEEVVDWDDFFDEVDRTEPGEPIYSDGTGKQEFVDILRRKYAQQGFRS